MSSSRQVRIEFRDKIKLKGCDLLGGGGDSERCVSYLLLYIC